MSLRILVSLTVGWIAGILAYVFIPNSMGPIKILAIVAAGFISTFLILNLIPKT